MKPYVNTVTIILSSVQPTILMFGCSHLRGKTKMLQTYLNQLTPPELADSVKNTVDGFMGKLSQTEPKIAQNVLLLGNVQSGKTAQVLGVLSALADDGDHKVFFVSYY